MLNKIIDELKLNSASHNKEFAESLIPGVKTLLGVKVPILRKMAKEISKNNPIEFLENNNFIYYELEMLQAMVIGYMKLNIDEKLAYAKSFIPLIHDWSVCDTFCQTFKDAKTYQEQVWELLMLFKDSKEEFEKRVVVCMMMNYFINDQYIDKVIDFIKANYLDEYYYKMGVAWCMQVIMMKYPTKGIEILENNYLDKWIHNKSISKMMDSFRINNDLKIELKKYRRK